MTTPARPTGRAVLAGLGDRLRAGEDVPSVSVRTLLAWFGQHRRGWRVVHRIQLALRHANLQTHPDFTTAYIDGDLTFSLLPEKPATKGATSSQPGSNTSSSPSPTDISSVPEAEDPALRVRMLPAANRTPVTVTRDDTIRKALTLMAMHDYSQLPVTQDLRSIDGMISWRSISLSEMTGRPREFVRDCLERYEDVRGEDSLFRAFGKIVEHEVVLVRGKDQAVSGIVTATDLSIMFREQTEPFLLLSEIENQLRHIIGEHFDATELAAARNPQDKTRDVDSVADLTFGECVRLIEKPDHWARLGLSLDRKTFQAQLSEVCDIRNDVMHFDPDGPSDDELQRLKDVRKFLQRMQ